MNRNAEQVLQDTMTELSARWPGTLAAYRTVLARMIRFGYEPDEVFVSHHSPSRDIHLHAEKKT